MFWTPERTEHVSLTVQVGDEVESVRKDLALMDTALDGQLYAGCTVSLNLHIAYYQGIAAKLEAFSRVLDKAVGADFKELQHGRVLVGEVLGKIERLQNVTAAS